MFDFDENLVFALLIYLGSCYVLYEMKHEKMFDNDSNFKCFGLHENETVFPFWLVTSMIGLFSYYILILRSKNYM